MGVPDIGEFPSLCRCEIWIVSSHCVSVVCCRWFQYCCLRCAAGWSLLLRNIVKEYEIGCCRIPDGEEPTVSKDEDHEQVVETPVDDECIVY